jgi:hypothetical protein
MAKENGIGFSVSIDDAATSAQVVSNDITDLSISTPVANADTTGLDKSAHERLQLLRDGKVSMNGCFNDAANKSHAVLKTIAAASSVIRTVALGISGQTLAMEMFGNDYSLARGGDGGLKWATSFDLGDGTSPTWS